MPLSPTETYKKAITELYYWQYSKKEGKGHSSCFHSQLFDLIHKADGPHLQALQRGFPMEVRAWKEWCCSGDYGNDLFREHGLLEEN